VEHFVSLFSRVCTNTSASGANKLKNKFDSMRNKYCGQPLFENYLFDTELVERVISSLTRVKAADIDGPTSEHVQ